MEVFPYSYFRRCDISEVLGCHLLQQISSQWGSQILLQRLVSHQLTAYLSDCGHFLTQWNGRKPYKFESHNSLKLRFTNIRGLCSNFVDCKSYLESNSPDVLALCETNLDDSINSGNFFVRCYLIVGRGVYSPFFQILSTPSPFSLSSPTPTLTALSVVVFVWLNVWSRHIWCAIFT